ncbi:MAG: ribose 5-phosphate isomerase B [Kineosporiaceae bacterium]|nr:ribose 5-phosphate isomerase B [Aeromicrobium sp.]
MSNIKTIALGNDEAAVGLRETITAHLKSLGYAVDVFGPSSVQESVDYPDIAVEVAQRIANGDYERGILICGTGIGMAIAANKVPGIRAAQAADNYSAERARKSNNAQILALGARTLGPELAKSIVDSWLTSEYEGKSDSKVNKLIALDKRGEF